MENTTILLVAVLLLIPLVFSQLPTQVTIDASGWETAPAPSPSAPPSAPPSEPAPAPTAPTQPPAPAPVPASSSGGFSIIITKPEVGGKTSFNVDEEIQFDAIALASNAEMAAKIISITWHWDFGDSSTSDSKNPTHKYAKDGAFKVKLTGTVEGKTESTEIELTIVKKVEISEECKACSTILQCLACIDKQFVQAITAAQAK